MTAAVRPLVRDDLMVIELDGEAVVYDETTGDIHQLNASATVVFDLCDGTSTVGQMASDIASAASVPRAQVEREIRALLRFFKQAGLLVASDGPARTGKTGRDGRPA